MKKLKESAEWPKYPLSREQVLSAAREIEKKKSTWVNIGYINKDPGLSALYKGGKINKATGEPYPTVEILKYSEAQYMSGFNYANSKNVKLRNSTPEWQARHQEGEIPRNPKIVSWIIPNIVGVTSAGNEVLSVISHPKNRPNVRYYISIDGEPFRQAEKQEVAQYLQPGKAKELLSTPEERRDRATYKDENGNAIEVNFATLYVSNIYAIKGEGTLNLMQHRRKPKDVTPPEATSETEPETVTEDKEMTSEGYFVYKSPITDQDIAEMITAAKRTYGYSTEIDGEYVGIEVNNDGSSYIYYKDVVISTNSPQETKAVLKDLETAIKDENSKQDEYIRQQLPYLWNRYRKLGYPKCVQGESVYSDVFKDAFGKRPRSSEMIEFEIQNAADNLGVTLD